MLNDLFTLNELTRIGAAVALVVIAAIISRVQEVKLEKQMLIAVVRAFIQLIAIGYALDLIFAADHPAYIIGLVMVMVLVASLTTGARIKGVPRARMLAFISISFGAAMTLVLLIALRVFQFNSQETIPVAGMVVGNAMTACTLIMKRLHDEIEVRRAEIEAALALGATRRQAILVHMRRALQSGMTPIIDTTKTVGLIKLPGAMTGMILAGASPLEAVQVQMIVMYMLIGAVSFTGLAAVWLTYRQFFTANHQLIIP